MTEWHVVTKGGAIVSVRATKMEHDGTLITFKAGRRVIGTFSASDIAGYVEVVKE